MTRTLGFWSCTLPRGLEAGESQHQSQLGYFDVSFSPCFLVHFATRFRLSAKWFPRSPRHGLLKVHACPRFPYISSIARAAGCAHTSTLHKQKLHLFFVKHKRDVVSSVPWRVHHLQGGSIRAKQLSVLQVQILESFSSRTPLRVEQRDERIETVQRCLHRGRVFCFNFPDPKSNHGSVPVLTRVSSFVLKRK